MKSLPGSSRQRALQRMAKRGMSVHRFSRTWSNSDWIIDRDRWRRHFELCAHLDKLGVKVIAIPKTMDNDVRNTEYCVGFFDRDHPTTGAIGRQRIRWDRMSGWDLSVLDAMRDYVAIHRLRDSIRCCLLNCSQPRKAHRYLLTDKRITESNYTLS